MMAPVSASPKATESLLFIGQLRSEGVPVALGFGVEEGVIFVVLVTAVFSSGRCRIGRLLGVAEPVAAPSVLTAASGNRRFGVGDAPGFPGDGDRVVTGASANVRGMSDFL